MSKEEKKEAKVGVNSEAKSKNNARKALAKRMIQRKQKQAGQSTMAFSDEFKLELKRIVWPTRKNVIKAAVLILIVMTVSTIVVFAFDFTFAQLFLRLKKIG